MSRVVAAPLVAEQSVGAHRVLVRPGAPVDRVDGPDRQRRGQLTRLPDAPLGVHEAERPAVYLEVAEVLPRDRLLPVVGTDREPRLRLPPETGVELVDHDAGP